MGGGQQAQDASAQGGHTAGGGYQPNLDGLRAVAVTSVVAFHLSGQNLPVGGWIGVDLFFALSGYLITSLLIKEAQAHGAISLRDFWARRWLRLAPALAVALAAFSAYALLGGSVTTSSGDPVPPLASMGWVGSALVYITNWFQAFGRESPIELGHLWSLAVEEQFYIVWPLAFALIWHRARAERVRAVMGVAVAGVVGSLVLTAVVIGARGWNSSSWAFVYYATPTRIGGMLGGAVLASAWALRTPNQGWSRRGAWRWVCRGSVALFALLAMTSTVEYFPFVLPLVLVVTTVMVAGAVDARCRVAQLLQLPIMRWVGRRSYGIYLWHEIYRGVFQPLPRLAAVAVAVIATLLTAELTFRVVETPALRAKARFVRL